MTNVLLVLVLIAVAALLVLTLMALRAAGKNEEVAPIDLTPLESVLQTLKESDETLRREVNESLASGRKEAGEQAFTQRQEVLQLITQLKKDVGDSIERATKQMQVAAKQQEDQLEKFSSNLTESLKASQAGLKEMTAAIRTQGEKVSGKLDEKLGELRKENTAELDKIRKTVDEQLQTTLEKRISASFRQVSESLESVQKGLGEMQVLAADVGSLERTLSGVKTRGTWGEVQLESLLSEILRPEQYETQFAVKDGGGERVDFAIRLPHTDEHGESILLPVDAKFPQADYEEILDARDRADKEGVEKARAKLGRAIRNYARDIHEKYVQPGRTTEVAIMYVPSEGLFAEVAQIPDLLSALYSGHRVVVAGPTSLTPVLNTIRVGYRLVTIEHRSREVWNTLGQVRTEFEKFGDGLQRVQRSLTAASKNMDKMTTRQRQMARALERVEHAKLPDDASALGFDENGAEGEDFEDGADEDDED